MSPSFYPSSFGAFKSTPTDAVEVPEEPEAPEPYEPPDHSDLVPLAHSVGRRNFIAAVYRARFAGRPVPDHVDLVVAMAALDAADLPPSGELIAAYCGAWQEGYAVEAARQK